MMLHAPFRQRPLPSDAIMNKKFAVLALCAFFVPAAFVAGCGDSGIPGNAVAEVDGTPIEKADFEHWMTVAAKSGGQGASVPKPPAYTECIAQAKKTAPKPQKGQPVQTDADYKKSCEQQYNTLRDQVLSLLISMQWIEREAKDQGIKVTDAEVKKTFDEQKKQSFPKEADYQKFIKQSGQTQEDILQRVKLDLLSNKIRDKVVKGKDNVSDKAIADFYNKNKARFAQPEKRDLRVVLTKGKADAEKAQAALDSGQSWTSVAKKYSIDDTSKASGGKLPAQAKGTLDQELDKAVFGADKGELVGPVKTQYGYYVFSVTGITEASQQTLAEAKETIKQTLASQGQQTALDKFVKDFTKRWKEKTECSEGYKTTDCKNGPKATPTPAATDPTQGQVPTDPTQGTVPTDPSQGTAPAPEATPAG